MKKIFIFSLITLFILSASLYSETLWRDDFNKIENWYDNKTDTSFQANINPGKKAGTADIIQKGESNWGKVAFVLKDVDLNLFNIIQVNAADVDKNADYKILVTNLDWTESYIIIDRGAGKGTHSGNIKDITGWSEKKSFNLVIVVEGKNKKVTLDWIELISQEQKPEQENK